MQSACVLLLAACCLVCAAGCCCFLLASVRVSCVCWLLKCVFVVLQKRALSSVMLCLCAIFWVPDIHTTLEHCLLHKLGSNRPHSARKWPECELQAPNKNETPAQSRQSKVKPHVTSHHRRRYATATATASAYRHDARSLPRHASSNYRQRRCLPGGPRQQSAVRCSQLKHQ